MSNDALRQPGAGEVSFAPRAEDFGRVLDTLFGNTGFNLVDIKNIPPQSVKALILYLPTLIENGRIGKNPPPTDIAAALPRLLEQMVPILEDPQNLTTKYDTLPPGADGAAYTYCQTKAKERRQAAAKYSTADTSPPSLALKQRELDAAKRWEDMIEKGKFQPPKKVEIPKGPARPQSYSAPGFPGMKLR